MQSIKIANLSKNYGNKIIFSNFSSELKSDSIYGLVGKNGAGKTTFLNIISNLIPSYGGDVFINENMHVFYSGVNIDFDGKVKNFLKMVKYLTSSAIKIDNLEEWIKIKTLLNRKVASLSTGEKKKVQIAAAIVSGSQILLFDEPYANLDPLERKNFTEVIKKLKKNRIIIISSHSIEDLSGVISNLLLINNQRIIDYKKEIPSKQKLLKVMEDKNE